MQIIDKKLTEISITCDQHQVRELFVFGSVLTDKFSKTSDIDFVVDFLPLDPIDYAENYFELKFALENIFNRKIDLLESKAIRNNTFREAINKTKKQVYARRSQGLA